MSAELQAVELSRQRLQVAYCLNQGGGLFINYALLIVWIVDQFRKPGRWLFW